MMRRQSFYLALLCLAVALYAEAAHPLVESLAVGIQHPVTITTANPPAGWVADAALGVLRHSCVRGQVVHAAREGVRGLFETRAVRTPQGDLLLMFPEGNHYAAEWLVCAKIPSDVDEGRPINLGGGEVLFLARTPTGRLWTARSLDDGKTWSEPGPSALVHPDAPPMLFHLSDGKTLIAFHHNRHIATQYVGLSGEMDGMRDRAEIWFALSGDGGRSWSKPRFVVVNAMQPDPHKSGWFNHNASYLDAVIDKGVIHLFCPHLWNRALHFTIREEELGKLSAVSQLAESTESP